MSVFAKGPLVRLGDALFRWRNLVFPAVVVGLLLSMPPAHTLAGSPVFDAWRDSASAVVMLLGLSIRFYTIGWAYIQRGGRNKRVHADELVTAGCFAVSRNPLYVGNIVLYAGVFLLHGAVPVMLAGIGFFVLAYVAIVAAEEYFLRRTFGAAYAAYCADVPRWWPKLEGLRAATAGMRFSLYRAVTKDYTTIASASLAMLAVTLLERYHHAASEDFRQSVGVAALLALLVAAAAGLAKIYKKQTASRMSGN